MSGEGKQLGGGSSDARDASQVFGPLFAALSTVDEAQRYRLLASFLAELAEQSGGIGRTGKPADHTEALAKKVQQLDKERAALDDKLRTTRADLAHREKQLEAEQARGKEVQQVIDDQRGRLKDIENELQDVEAQLVARNAEIHQAEVKNEELQLKIQRAESAAGDHSQADELERSRIGLSKDLEKLRAEMDQLRADKDAEIARLKEDVAKVQSTSSEGPDALLADLWQRLARAKPPLAEGHVQPNAQAAERLVDALIELVRFVDDFDKSMRVFLSRYTKYHPSVKVPWEAYAKGDDLYDFARRTVAPQGGRPVGPLKMRLRLLYAWTYAAMVGADSAIESIESELHAHLMGEYGAGADQNRKIKEYVFQYDGPERFAQHLKEHRSLKLAETYGRG